MNDPIIRVADISKSFGGLKAVQGVSFDIAAGELVGLVGPNGSGKTTLINLVTGYLEPDLGGILLRGRQIGGHSPHEISKRGLMRMFQHSRIFDGLTCRENLLTCGFAMGLDRADCVRRADVLLHDLGLAIVAGEKASNLSGGQRKLVEFGSCFMGEPSLVVLDEPFSAIHVTIKDKMATYIRQRNEAGQTFLIVSHDIPFIVNLCSRSVVMANGRVIADGPTMSALRHQDVIEAYLGTQAMP